MSHFQPLSCLCPSRVNSQHNQKTIPSSSRRTEMSKANLLPSSPADQKNNIEDDFSQTYGQWKFKRDGFILSYTSPLTNFYDLEQKKLGQGSYGSVCRAVNRSTKTVRAVKTIPKSKVKNVQRFKQEIDIMKMLDHPNIIKLYETFEDHKNIYLVMELCRGGELFDRIIEEGFFGEVHARHIMRQIIAALYYLHQHGIVHRDLKPENFLFLDRSKDSPLKIIDFGLAAKCCQDTQLATKAGTPYYVAPQVLQGNYTYKCDMWSAGVIMYILLCGYPPFHGENDTEILAKVKRGKFTFNEVDWKSASNEAKDLIRKLLSYDANKRLTAEQALNHPWIKRHASKSTPDIPFTQIIERFRAFRTVAKLKKAALTVIAQQMNEGQIRMLKNIFLALDENGDGTLSIQEIRAGLLNNGWKELPDDFEQLMQEVDSDGSGVIDYTEFIAATMDKRIYIQEDICWAAFQVFDLNANGRISADELKKILGTNEAASIKDEIDNASTVTHQPKISDFRLMIQEVNNHGDGEIDFDDFMDMMRGDA